MQDSKWTTERWIEYRKRQGKQNPEIPYTSAEMGRRYRAKYPDRNRKRMRDYYRRTWGISNRKIGAEGELLAVNKILPALGFNIIKHISRQRRFFIFDVIAWLNGKRVVVEITTARWRRVDRGLWDISEALGLPLYLLFIKPDFKKYQLIKVDRQMPTTGIHLEELCDVSKL